MLLYYVSNKYKHLILSFIKLEISKSYLFIEFPFFVTNVTNI